MENLNMDSLINHSSYKLLGINENEPLISVTLWILILSGIVLPIFLKIIYSIIKKYNFTKKEYTLCLNLKEFPKKDDVQIFSLFGKTIKSFYILKLHFNKNSEKQYQAEFHLSNKENFSLMIDAKEYQSFYHEKEKIKFKGIFLVSRFGKLQIDKIIKK